MREDRGDHVKDEVLEERGEFGVFSIQKIYLLASHLLSSPLVSLCQYTKCPLMSKYP